METSATSKKRLLALDVMRGITIAGMILVNNPGGDNTFAPLEHVSRAIPIVRWLPNPIFPLR